MLDQLLGHLVVHRMDLRGRSCEHDFVGVDLAEALDVKGEAVDDNLGKGDGVDRFREAVALAPVPSQPALKPAWLSVARCAWAALLVAAGGGEPVGRQTGCLRTRSIR